MAIVFSMGDGQTHTMSLRAPLSAPDLIQPKAPAGPSRPRGFLTLVAWLAAVAALGAMAIILVRADSALEARADSLEQAALADEARVHLDSLRAELVRVQGDLADAKARQQTLSGRSSRNEQRIDALEAEIERLEAAIAAAPAPTSPNQPVIKPPTPHFTGEVVCVKNAQGYVEDCYYR